MAILEDDDSQVGRDLFSVPFTARGYELAGDELAGGGVMPRNGAREGCESDTIEDYRRSDLRPVEE